MRYVFKLRYQGERKAVGFYAEMVGLQKLQIQSASLVAIGANPLDFLPTASPSSHHPHRPPGTVNLLVLFPRTYFFLPDTFFRKTFFRRKQGASLTQISPTRTFWSLAHSYILGGGKLVLKIKMSGAERFWCLRSLLASVASPCARTGTWLVSSESPRPALSCRLSHVTLAAL